MPELRRERVGVCTLIALVGILAILFSVVLFVVFYLAIIVLASVAMSYLPVHVPVAK